MGKNYTLAEIKRINKEVGGVFFDKSHTKNDRKVGAKITKNGHEITVSYPNGVKRFYIFNPETGHIRPHNN